MQKEAQDRLQLISSQTKIRIFLKHHRDDCLWLCLTLVAGVLLQEWADRVVDLPGVGVPSLRYLTVCLVEVGAVGEHPFADH